MGFGQDILDSIFDCVPKDGTNIKESEEDDNGYENLKGANAVSFVDKVEELQSKMTGAPPSKQVVDPFLDDIEKVVVPVKETKAEVKVEPVVEAKAPPVVPETVKTPSASKTEQLLQNAIGVQSVDLFADDPPVTKQAETVVKPVEQPKVVDKPVEQPKKVAEVKPLKVETAVIKSSNSSESDVIEDVEDIKESPVTVITTKVDPPKAQVDQSATDGEIDEWFTNSPSSRYDAFYREKRKCLKLLLKHGELPLDKYADELTHLSVDINVGPNDLNGLHERMVSVYAARDRVKEILLSVYRQNFLWERMVTLLEGFLARVEYDRGKQDGVIHEHMIDMEIYRERLKEVVKSAEKVDRNLEAAFECLSRQVTIALPMREVQTIQRSQVFPVNESVMENKPSKPKVDAKELAQFDSLDGDEPKASVPKKPVEPDPFGIGDSGPAWGSVAKDKYPKK